MHNSKIPIIRRLARSGDTMRAWQMFTDAALEGDRHPDTLTLKGRLLKDRGLSAPSTAERTRLLGAARQAYLSAAAMMPATYPLINAATIALLEGNQKDAAILATRVLTMLDAGDHEPETAYWLHATRAEACLLLGEIDKGQAVLAQAVRQAPRAWEDHASTLRHFRLIMATLARPAEWLDAYRPPASLHFSGIIHVAPDQAQSPERIAEAVDRIRPGFAFGALAAGADIMVAEALLERDVELHVMLPATIEGFRHDSVSRFGTHWEARFDAILEAAASVETIEALDAVSQSGIYVGDEMAMGCAIRHARQLESHAVALRLGDGTRAQGSLLDAAWRDRGLPIERVPLERSGSTTSPPPTFAREALVAVPDGEPADHFAHAGAALVRHGAFTIARFDDPVAAARIALADVTLHGRTLGVTYGAYDPAGNTTQRLETAVRVAGAGLPGQVPVSRSLALALTLHAPDLHCENFGQIASAQGDLALGLLAVR
ncbi:TRAFs-binding domain-containing protein [Novosphingobium sp. EMRT-2]|uniref:TRAFs-binding domain-containing protein n=1 Tax=Novosphingobium sp. EMRT-2 TaxID=2571749 RepID=UPI0010BE01C3|nr:TRAFs-binding domain-containing protein [Novosphingobium sp. EMRT-2]QCI94670.1 DUF4071 domain-containing protein [Novosphingobium sp. EMRT-2]